MSDRPKLNGANGAAHGPALRSTSGGGAPSAAPAAAAPRVGAHDIVRIAASAVVDPKTVRDYLRGRASRSTTRTRIEAALISCGHPELVRRETA